MKRFIAATSLCLFFAAPLWAAQEEAVPPRARLDRLIGLPPKPPERNLTAEDAKKICGFNKNTEAECNVEIKSRIGKPHTRADAKRLFDIRHAPKSADSNASVIKRPVTPARTSPVAQ